MRDEEGWSWSEIRSLDEGGRATVPSPRPVNLLDKSALGAEGSQLRLDSTLLLPSNRLLLLLLSISGVWRETSSSRPLLECCCPGSFKAPADASFTIFPTPSKKPVMVRTTSSLTRRPSRYSPPTLLQISPVGISPGISSSISASICCSRARFVPVLSNAFNFSEARTIVSALRNRSGTDD